jgi:hypothetical protein
MVIHVFQFNASYLGLMSIFAYFAFCSILSENSGASGLAHRMARFWQTEHIYPFVSNLFPMDLRTICNV